MPIIWQKVDSRKLVCAEHDVTLWKSEDDDWWYVLVDSELFCPELWAKTLPSIKKKGGEVH